MDEIVNEKFKVKKIIFYNSSNKWGVLATEPLNKERSIELSLLNNFGNVCISGNFGRLYEDCIVEVSGFVIENPKYGKQVQIKKLRVLPDDKSKEGIINFLARCTIRGISVRNAEKIYNKYKDKAIDVVLNDADALISILGIGEKTIAKIKESAEKYKKQPEFYKFCTDLGLPYSLITKIDDELGDKALEILKTNPYEILNLTQAISFKQVDEIYLSQGGDPTSTKRLDTGLVYTLKRTVMLEGSTGCSSSTLKKRFYDLLELQEAYMYYEKTIDRLDGSLVEVNPSDGIVFYKKYTDIEKSISEKIEVLNTLAMQSKDIEEEVIENEIQDFPFELNEQQKLAIRGCLKRTVSVLTGSPGTGKSTITKALYNIYRKSGYNVELLAPTSKACRRLEECIGGCAEASTLHKFLGLYKEEEEPKDLSGIDNTVFIIDEASMLDIMLFNYLLCKVNLTSRVLLVGDNNQLPSVQAGNVLGDLISSGKVHVSILTDVMRQSENSHIIKYCTDVNNGRIFDPCEFSDFHYEEFGDGQELLQVFIPKYLADVKEYGLNEVQVVTPYKKGELGQNNINTILQASYNARGLEIVDNFRLGDRVRHTRNNYKKDVYNGEVGIVTGEGEDGGLEVNYGDKIISYDNSDLDELTLAYCSTVHASQGSEYKVCFVILDDSTGNELLLIRRLLYTAVSRGKQKVYILAKPYLADRCIENNSYKARITRLKEYLRNTQSSSYTFA